jgi:hypothetical protein
MLSAATQSSNLPTVTPVQTIRRRFVPSGAGLLGLFSLAACADNGFANRHAVVYGVEVTGSRTALPVGAIDTLEVTVTGGGGLPLLGRSVTWTSSAPTVVTVDALGVVTAVTPGHATVTATVEGRRAAAHISVTGNPPTATITVNPNRQFQRMTGWEALAGTGYGECDRDAYRAYMPELIARTAEELKINRLRIPLRGGYEERYDSFLSFQRGDMTFDGWKRIMFLPRNDNDDPFVIDPAGFQWAHVDFTIEELVLPLKQRLQALGDDLWLNLGYTGAKRGQNLYRDEPEEHAELALAAFRHLKEKYNLVPNSIDIVNEPNLGVWNARHVARNLLAIKRRLNAAGFFPEIIAPSSSHALGTVQYLDEMARVPGVVEAIDELAYHRYGVTRFEHLQAVARRGAQYGVRTAMTEHIGSGYEDLHEDLTVANVSAWQQFGLAFCDDGEGGGGGLYFVIHGAKPGQNAPQIVTAKTSTYLRQYFRYVRLGAVRVDATSANGAFAPVAFRNMDGRFVVVVKAVSGGSFSVAGLPPGRYGIEYTTRSQYARSQPDVSIAEAELLSATIPEAGALTVYAK